jgi:uncharacterized small protein (DUF1192 family)
MAEIDSEIAAQEERLRALKQEKHDAVLSELETAFCEFTNSLDNLCSLAERIARLQQEVKPEEAETANVIPPQREEIEALFDKTLCFARLGLLTSERAKFPKSGSNSVAGNLGAALLGVGGATAALIGAAALTRSKTDS